MIDEIDPIKFVQSKFTLQGKPFTIIGTDEDLDNARHYMTAIYHTMAFVLPKVKKPMVIVKGRQVEFTTTVANMTAYYLAEKDFFDVLYAVPKSDQAKRFSDTRIDPLQRYKIDTEILKPIPNGTYNKSVKQFDNGSTLYIYGTADKGDVIRGIAVQALLKDEYQDMDRDAEEAIDETLTHSKYKINITLGTPKYTGTRYEERWEQSTKQYYHIPCSACNHFYVLQWDLAVREHIFRCPKCGHEDDKRERMRFGKWIALGNPNADYIGFHLSQLYVPYITKEEIDFKLRQKEKEGADVQKYFKNEILGEFYCGNVEHVDKSAILKGFDEKAKYDIFIPLQTSVYMGIDWGGWNVTDQDPDSSFTVVSVGAVNNKGQLFVNYVEILTQKDELLQVKRISELMSRYHVRLAVADKGYGKIKNMELKKLFPGRFRECKYVQGSSSLTFKERKDDGSLLINRDYSLEELYNAMTRSKMVIPLNRGTEWIIQHFLNHAVVIEERANIVYKHYIKEQGPHVRTDAVHSLNYLRIASFFDKNAGEYAPLVAAATAAQKPPRPMLSGNGISSMDAQLKQNFRKPIVRKGLE